METKTSELRLIEEYSREIITYQNRILENQKKIIALEEQISSKLHCKGGQEIIESKEVTIGKTWLPIKRYGKINAVDDKYTYTFRRETKRFTSYEEAYAYQSMISLRCNNNRYYIENNLVYLELEPGRLLECDQEDLPLLEGRTWSYINGKPIVRIDNRRVGINEIITGEKKTWLNGNSLDNRRCNLGLPPPKNQDLIPLAEWNIKKAEAKDSPDHIKDLAKELAEIPLVITFPFYRYTPVELHRDFNRLLEGRQDLISTNQGLKVARFYMQEVMFAARGRNYPSLEVVLSSKDGREKVWQTMLRLGMDRPNITYIIKAYALKYYKVSNFPPLVARNLYDYYLNPNVKHKRILDFCSGFGGRLLGFWASQTGFEYFGIDPNPNLVKPYQEIIKWLETNHPSQHKKITMLQAPAEDVDYKGFGKFDVIFTSPPYFDTEIYNSDDPNQSSNRYLTLSVWRDGFLFATLKKVIPCLNSGGILAINIKQVRHWPLDLVTEMCNYIQSFDGMQRLPDLSISFSVKPNTTNDNVEPIYVFRLV